jgi:hypothetical protein
MFYEASSRTVTCDGIRQFAILRLARYAGIALGAGRQAHSFAKRWRLFIAVYDSLTSHQR